MSKYRGQTRALIVNNQRLPFAREQAKVQPEELSVCRHSQKSAYSASRAKQRQAEGTVSEMSNLEELVLRSSTASAATLPHLRKVVLLLKESQNDLSSMLLPLRKYLKF